MRNKILLCLISLCFINGNIDKEYNPILIKVKMKGGFNFENFKKGKGIDFPDKKGTMEFYPAEISIINNTDYPIQYWEMNCSWPNNWICSNKKFILYYGTCAQNFPVKREIISHKKISYDALIYCKMEDKLLANEEIKLGFIWLKKSDYKFTSDDYWKVLEKKKNDSDGIVWSEPFKLNNM